MYFQPVAEVMVRHTCGCHHDVATHIDLLNLSQDLRIWFNYKSNLTSAISKLANRNILASYVSRHNATAYDTHPHK
jgi:hypothetical protein